MPEKSGYMFFKKCFGYRLINTLAPSQKIIKQLLLQDEYVSSNFLSQNKQHV